MGIATLAPIALWLVCFTVLNILVKTLSRSLPTGRVFEQALVMAQSPVFYVAGFLYVACALLYFVSLSRLPLSTAGPVFMILGVATTVIIGASVFGETLNSLKLLGIIICLAGVGLVFYD